MSTHARADLGPIAAAERAVDATRDLAHLTRPAITTLNIEDLHALSGALAELAATVPQILTQIRSYLDPHAAIDAHTHLTHARRVADEFAAAVHATHQSLGDTAETIRTNHEGVNFQPT